MITEILKRCDVDLGIYAINIFTGVKSTPSIKTIFASECDHMYLDHESGGVWYQYKTDADATGIPKEQFTIYVAPAAIAEIAFNKGSKQSS